MSVLLRKSFKRISTGLARPINRREFLRRSGIGLGGSALASQLPFNLIRPAEAQSDAQPNVVVRRTVCPFCSVGCSIDATVENGVWTRQNPVWESPLNLGAHCAKGAAAREMTIGERRLKHPMKLVDGKYRRISWDQALKEVSDKILEIRKSDGPDAVFWVGSSKHGNEQSYMMRKFVSLWGSNNCDHQARICHSTTVAGVANTFGFGAMTNSYNDMLNSKAILFIGSNAAEAHPVAMQFILHSKENGARVVVVDPRFTRTAAKAHHHIRIRPGTDIPFVWGVLRTIFENGWEDRKYIADRVYGMDEVRKEVAKWTPDRVQEVTGIPGDDVRLVAEMMAKNRPSTVIWCMGITQHHIGHANVRALCVLQMALGNVGVSGGGTNIFRGHDNVQGATDVGPNPESLPAYYGVSTGAWKHWAAVWGVDYEWIKGRFADQEVMEKPGITVSRWIDGVLEKNEHIDQGPNLKAVVYWGHSPNSQTRGAEMAEAMKRLQLLVVIDPYPSATAAMGAMARRDGVYLLPATTQFETDGSVTASNRSLQWREQVVEPIFEARKDQTIMVQLAKRLGFGDEFTRNYKMNGDEPSIEDALRELNRGSQTIGYSGQSPERLKLHMKNQHTFDIRTLRAQGGPCDGDYYGLPWPCWGTAAMKHPGTPNLYDTSKRIMDGGLNFRANWGVEREGVSMLAGDGSHTKDADLPMGYPEFDSRLLKLLGWWDELSDEEKKAADGKNWKTDLSFGTIRVALKHGCAPFGNGKGRALVWNFPDAVPVHREPLYSPRRDLVAKYPTYEDKKVFWRLPTLYRSIQAQDYSKRFPLIVTSGRLVEFEGGGEETRSIAWLAEFQQEMFCEVNPADANDRGIADRDFIWVQSPSGAHIKVRALLTPRVGRGVVFMPFHFSGWFQGKNLRDKYPEGASPYVLGEAVNTNMTYGYDAVTMMQETKVSLCQIEKA
ncbi:MAG TPA: formate dehydrogenase subunit alpha [Burkholderiales bacterium]|nr:formate dehydrogenase subunit alpha [Burkholderiales bacterium]